jgi:DNA-binding CsgD family transcriptional regulator
MEKLPNAAESSLGAVIAALNGENFETALSHWLGRCLEIDNVTLLAYYQNRAPSALYTQAADPRVHAELASTYIGGAYLLDPFHELHVKKAPRGLYRLKDIAPDQFHRNPYYSRYYRCTTLIDELAFVAYSGTGVSLHVCLGRDATSNRRFATREIETAQRIAPIVISLAEVRWSGLRSSGSDPESYQDSEVARRLIDAARAEHGVSLSGRQAAVALLILRGHSSASIGLRLGISPQTVKVFRKQLYRKCTISSQAELFSLMMPLLRG